MDLASRQAGAVSIACTALAAAWPFLVDRVTPQASGWVKTLGLIGFLSMALVALLWGFYPRDWWPATWLTRFTAALSRCWRLITGRSLAEAVARAEQAEAALRIADEQLALQAIALSARPQEATLEAAPALAPREDVMRLVEVYSACGPAITFAYEFLFADICGAAATTEQRYIAALVRDHVARSCQQDKENLDMRFSTISNNLISSAVEFDDFLIALAGLVNGKYHYVLGHILQAGDLFVGRDQLLLAPGYGGLHKRHSDALREIWRVRELPGLALQESRWRSGSV